MKVMKSFLMITAMALAAPAFGESASPTSGKFAVGVQGGLTFADFHEENTGAGTSFDSKTGWMGGLFLEFGIWTITLRPEVNFVRKEYGVGSFTDVRTDRLELNALLKFNPLGPGPFSPFILLGPQWSNHLKTTVSSGSGTAVATVRSSDRWDIAGVGALGIDFNLAENIALGAQGRYVFGFRDLDESTVEIKTRDIQALLSLTFQNAF